MYRTKEVPNPYEQIQKETPQLFGDPIVMDNIQVDEDGNKLYVNPYPDKHDLNDPEPDFIHLKWDHIKVSLIISIEH